MTTKTFAGLLALGAAAMSGPAHAAVGTADLWISGGGVSGHLTLTYTISGTGANPIADISGVISDASLGITSIKRSSGSFRSTRSFLCRISSPLPISAIFRFRAACRRRRPPSPAQRSRMTTPTTRAVRGPSARTTPSSAGCLTSTGSRSRSPMATPSIYGAMAFFQARPRPTMASLSRRRSRPSPQSARDIRSPPSSTSPGEVTVAAPEPSTWAMMLLGFAGLGFAGYRKSHKAGPVGA